MVGSATAGPSNPKKPVDARKRKAGGSGKKGKIFVEDKSALLSLIGDVTESKDSVRESKLAKHRSYTAPAASTDQLGEEDLEEQSEGVRKVKTPPKEVSASDKRRKEKDRALAEAKASIAAKAREKKRRKGNVAASSSRASTSAPPKKKVGFA